MVIKIQKRPITRLRDGLVNDNIPYKISKASFRLKLFVVMSFSSVSALHADRLSCNPIANRLKTILGYLLLLDIKSQSTLQKLVHFLL